MNSKLVHYETGDCMNGCTRKQQKPKVQHR